MRSRAFTLIELMIVVAIIAFLAIIAVPNFNRFMAKAKRAEVYMHLSSLYAAQKAYHAEYGRYTTQLFGAESLGWQPQGYKGGGSAEKFYYTYGFGTGAEGRSYFTGKLGTASSYLSGAFADDKHFKIRAAGDILNNGKPDIFEVDEHNNITLIQDSLG